MMTLAIFSNDSDANDEDGDDDGDDDGRDNGDDDDDGNLAAMSR